MTYDIFISYAHDDKESLVFPLAQKLRQKGYRVWFDEFCLSVSDSLIDNNECEFSDISGKLEMKYTKKNVKPLTETKFVFKNINIL